MGTMGSLPQCAPGPAATVTRAARSLRRGGGSSSLGMLLLAFDGLLTNPRRHQHALVSGALLQRGAPAMGASSIRSG